MARINVEDKLFNDLRFHKLSEKHGRWQAIGMLVDLWKIGQEFWKKDQLIPENIYLIYEFPDSLEKLQFIEKRENGIYVKGSVRNFAWYKNCVKNGTKGGRPPKINDLTKPMGYSGFQNQNPDEPNPFKTETQNNPLTLTTCSSSSSSSFSDSDIVVAAVDYNMKSYKAKPKAKATPKAKAEVKAKDKPIDKDSGLDQIVKGAIDELNFLTDKQFSSKSTTTAKMIANLLEHGYTPNDISIVLNDRFNEWSDIKNSDGQDMLTFFTPATLFKLEKFEKYFDEAMSTGFYDR